MNVRPLHDRIIVHDENIICAVSQSPFDATVVCDAIPEIPTHLEVRNGWKTSMQTFTGTVRRAVVDE